MNITLLYQATAYALVAVFVYYGMDMRHKRGAKNFVAPLWQILMRILSFALIVTFVYAVSSVHTLAAVDYLALLLMAGGTGLVIAAKQTLGKAHTFTGQYLSTPKLVMHGVYAFTRNPLYLGVFQCEIGASLFLLNQAPTAWPQTWPYWLCGMAAALVYVVSFNLVMAVNEATYLENHFGDRYRRYRARVPFLMPFTRRLAGDRR